ncbi:MULTISPECIES: hypothetical protein [Bacillus]|uniref:hypothetical protein n=1 Tax=Bacillus TaxID=1386 RepID=UPI00059B8AA9|nr:hypothetical protein [Bacillus amyloliquefaciens]KYC92425.1 hypothetical protein B425_4079 [Bacillus amyloliquefaciens]MEC1840857.1 hypothetical protein [Bacillus amyloliquefaciens]MEC2051348.1 hypothetical protein [Bacillus amyloliquefaciens]OXL18180.1 hypothetical protein CFI04_18695 [Bacillus amyloliquefaciens]WJM58107.1 hypothetical protein QTN45_00200 [Bacillus amyloliquefaciens]
MELWNGERIWFLRFALYYGEKWKVPLDGAFVSLVLEMILGLILKPMRVSIGLFLRQGISLLIKA